MNDTPKTDSNLFIIQNDSYECSAWMESTGAASAGPDAQYVPADFARELERENAKLRECGKALRDALAFECHKIGGCSREIDAWDGLVSLPNAPADPHSKS